MDLQESVGVKMVVFKGIYFPNTCSPGLISQPTQLRQPCTTASFLPWGLQLC